MKSTACLFSFLVLGCSASKTSDDTSDFEADVPPEDTASEQEEDTAESEDTGEPPEEPQTTINVTWSTEGMTIEIENGPLSAYNLGLVDTLNDDGWRGEDCLNGMAGERFCHPLGAEGGSLITVYSIDLIEAGSTTRHTQTEGSENALTYALLDTDGNCLATFGHLPDYYTSSELACPEAGTSK